MRSLSTAWRYDGYRRDRATCCRELQVAWKWGGGDARENPVDTGKTLSKSDFLLLAKSSTRVTLCARALCLGLDLLRSLPTAGRVYLVNRPVSQVDPGAVGATAHAGLLA